MLFITPRTIHTPKERASKTMGTYQITPAGIKPAFIYQGREHPKHQQQRSGKTPSRMPWVYLLETQFGPLQPSSRGNTSSATFTTAASVCADDNMEGRTGDQIPRGWPLLADHGSAEAFTQRDMGIERTPISLIGVYAYVKVIDVTGHHGNSHPPGAMTR